MAAKVIMTPTTVPAAEERTAGDGDGKEDHELVQLLGLANHHAVERRADGLDGLRREHLVVPGGGHPVADFLHSGVIDAVDGSVAKNLLGFLVRPSAEALGVFEIAAIERGEIGSNMLPMFMK